MWPNLQETADLITFTEEIFNRKPLFLSSIIFSLIPIFPTPRILSKKINLHAKKASSDPSFLQYLFKHNFFAMSAIALQRSQLLWPNDDEVSMWRHPFTSTLVGWCSLDFTCSFIYQSPVYCFIFIFFINLSGPCSKRSSYFGAPIAYFSVRRSMVC